MVGLDVHYHCPKCNCDRVTDLGCTDYIKYKGNTLAVIYCWHCGEKIASETLCVGSESSYCKFEDKTGLGVLSKLEKFFEDKCYTCKVSEETIETEMWNFAVESFNSVAIRYEYEIKAYIQRLLAQLNPVSLFSITFEDLDKESKEVGKCVYECLGTVCW